MMRSVVVTLAANEVRELALTGNYFELRTAVGVVTKIELLDKSGGVVSHLDEAEATDYVHTSSKFETVRVTNGATAQSIRFYHGEGETGSNRFTGIVSGEVSLSAATLAALESTDLNPATIAALIAGKYNVRPEAQTGFYNTVANLAANTPDAIFTPAANANGAILLDAAAMYQGAAFVKGGFISKASAPATIDDGSPVAFLCPATRIAGEMSGYVKSETPKFIAAGQGLYFICDQTFVSSHRGCRFILL